MDYIVKKDFSSSCKNKEFYIKAENPSCYLTDNMTWKELQRTVKSLQQLGHSVLYSDF